MTGPNIETAVQLLGQPAHEIKSVEKSDAGFVMEMVDGSAYVDVPGDAPDADGKTGLMYLRPPCEGYSGTFPFYARGEEAAIPAESPEDDPAEAETGADSEPEEAEKATIPVKRAVRKAAK